MYMYTCTWYTGITRICTCMYVFVHVYGTLYQGQPVNIQYFKGILGGGGDSAGIGANENQITNEKIKIAIEK